MDGEAVRGDLAGTVLDARATQRQVRQVQQAVQTGVVVEVVEVADVGRSTASGSSQAGVRLWGTFCAWLGLDSLTGALDPYATDVGRLRAQQALP